MHNTFLPHLTNKFVIGINVGADHNKCHYNLGTLLHYFTDLVMKFMRLMILQVTYVLRDISNSKVQTTST